MSFDLFLIPFRNGQPSAIPREAVRAAFGELVRWDDDESGWTRYSDMDGCSILMSPLPSDPSLTTCVSLNRPVGDERFWDSLYRIMRLGNVAAFFPGMRGPLIADPLAAAHLPSDTSELRGPPIVVSSGAEIIGSIRSC